MTEKNSIKKRRAIFVVNRNRQEAIDAELKLKSLLTDFEFVDDCLVKLHEMPLTARAEERKKLK